MGKLPPAIVQALEEERETLNARFRLRLRAGEPIDAAAFLAHLEQSLAPLATRVDACLPERTRGVVSQLYDVSLDLFASGQLGPSARTSFVQTAWQALLPMVPPRILALHPQQVAGCLSNAVIKIASQSGARPHDWLQTMQRVAPRCASLSELLEAGQVAAWQAGMVQYRRAALDTAERLPAQLAGLALGLAEDHNIAIVPQTLARLRSNLWWKAATAAASPKNTELCCVATAGAFTGLGGIFAHPPVVMLQGNRFLATDRQATWEMHFDAYGVWFRRIDDAPFTQSTPDRRADVHTDRPGVLRWGELSLTAPELVSTTSFACDGQTAAITIPTSHQVFLYSRLGSAA